MKRLNRRTFLTRSAFGLATGALAGSHARAQTDTTDVVDSLSTSETRTYAILADSGPFERIESAAFAEAEVDWSNPNAPEAVACTQCFAATELQQYLRQMTEEAENFAFAEVQNPPAGKHLIVVGSLPSGSRLGRLAASLGLDTARLDALGEEGYVIRSETVGDGLRVIFIRGNTRVGTLYGAYDFLHRLGCRWFAPGELHEEIPNLSSADIPDFEVATTPDFALRGFHAWENRGNPEFLLWMARNRMNYWCVQEDNHPYLQKLGIKMVWGEHTIGFAYLRPDDPYPYAHELFETDADLPPDPYPVSSYFLGDENGDGVLSYREAHPEWYAMNPEGDRVRTLGNVDYNYCTSNPHATEELLKNAIQELIDGEGQNATFVNCWTVDDGLWCHCPDCQALGSPTDRNLRFVRDFDQAVKRAQAADLIQRPITLLFLAYSDVLEPPTRPLPDNFDYDTCIATYFPIARSYAHNIDDPDSPTNRRYRQHLYGWAEDPDRHYRGRICIGEYYNVSGYNNLPIVFKRTMQNDIPWYYNTMNARYFHYMHVTTRNWGNKALTNYQMARQLWNYQTDCEALWSDYFAKRYGPVAEPLHAFYRHLETMLANCTELKYALPGRLSRGDDTMFPDAIMRYAPNPDEPGSGPSMVEIIEAADRCREIIDEALARTDLPARIQGRLEEDAFMFAYGENTVRFYMALVQANWFYMQENLDTARTRYEEAMRLADILREETEATRHGSSHSNATNAFQATRAGGALTTLLLRLGPPSAEEVMQVDLARENAIIMGNDFHGGGATLYGYGLSSFPGRIHLTDNGNYIYSSDASHSHMTAFFALEAAPERDVEAVMVGLICPLPQMGQVAGEVTLNDHVIFAGDMPFAEDALTEAPLTIPASAFQAGLNTLVFRNTTPGGPIGGRPWYGIHKIEMKAEG